MNFYPVRFDALLVAAMALAAATPAMADQPVLFSKPADPELANKANSFISPQQLGRAGAFNAPKSVFGGNSAANAFDVLPGARAPGAMTAEDQQWQKTLQDKKDWTLLTPREILGVPTAEKILGLPEPDGNDKLSPAERFLKRQDAAASARATNGYRSDMALAQDKANPFSSLRDDDGRTGQQSSPGNGMSQWLNPFARERAKVPSDTGPKADSIWASPFTQPAAMEKPNLDQMAAMDRFRALMESPTPPDQVSASPGYTPVPTPDPNLQPLPQFNPAGRSFTPMQSGITRPTGIAPLPTAIRPAFAPVTPVVKAQLPPWLSSVPTPFSGPPQRKF